MSRYYTSFIAWRDQDTQLREWNPLIGLTWTRAPVQAWNAFAGICRSQKLTPSQIRRRSCGRRMSSAATSHPCRSWRASRRPGAGKKGTGTRCARLAPPPPGVAGHRLGGVRRGGPGRDAAAAELADRAVPGHLGEPDRAVRVPAVAPPADDLDRAALTLATGGIIGVQVIQGRQDAEHLAEVPLIALMFLVMVWHGRRRLAATMERLTAMEEVQRSARRTCACWNSSTSSCWTPRTSCAPRSPSRSAMRS